MSSLDESDQDARHFEAVEQSELEAAAAFTVLPVRRTKYKNTFDQALTDILDLLDECYPDHFARQQSGCKNVISGHYDMLANPATKPDRARILVWWNQYMFTADGKDPYALASPTKR